MSTPPAKRATPAESAWKADASCRDLTPGLFFIEGISNIQRDQQRTDAKAVCAQCRVNTVLNHRQHASAATLDYWAFVLGFRFVVTLVALDDELAGGAT